MSNLIYLDNSATSFPKPNEVYEFMDSFYRTHGVSPGRSGFDAAIETEEELVALFGAYLQSEVLKAGHHGSKSSTGGLFLDTVKPAVAIISCGRNNSFGHPAFRVLKNLRDRGIAVLRTDEIGDVHFVSNGEFVELK